MEYAVSYASQRPHSPGLHGTYTHGYVAIGNFDGVHRGHQQMLQRLVSLARAAGRPAVVGTFDPHPLSILRAGGAPAGLTTIPTRLELLHQQGVDAVVVWRTTPQLLQLTADEFFQRVICDQLAATGLVEGPNFYFGKDRGGNITLLRQMCATRGMTLEVIEPVTCNSQWVSSSVIRSLLQAGDFNDAVQLLGHPYRLEGRVTTGAGRGRQLGFPTANLSDIPTVIPAPGVYAGELRHAGQRFAAAVNIGPNPTFGEHALKVEAHFLDFSGDLYEQTIAVDLRQRLRGVQKFASPAELQQQVASDLAIVRSLQAAVPLE